MTYNVSQNNAAVFVAIKIVHLPNRNKNSWTITKIFYQQKECHCLPCYAFVAVHTRACL